MARAAAIVDIDRTLLTGRPGRILGDALHRSGVAVAPGPLRPAVGAAATASLSMQLSLLAVHASRGWPDAAVREAAKTAAEAVVDDVAPYLRPLLDGHRSAGERLLLVSAAPPRRVCARPASRPARLTSTPTTSSPDRCSLPWVTPRPSILTPASPHWPGRGAGRSVTSTSPKAS